MESIALVACTKKKQDIACAAGELYMPSQRFRAARAYAERFADRYLILSAKHGLLGPATVIEPYEETLKGASVAVKRKWAAMVAHQMAEILPSPCHLSGGRCWMRHWRRPLLARMMPEQRLN